MKPFWKCWIETLLYVLLGIGIGFAIIFVATYIEALFGTETLIALIIFLIIVTVIAIIKWFDCG